MPKFTFFRQKCQDGSIHTGIDWEDYTYWELLEEENEERDPVLLWWVDLRGDGPGVPDSPWELPDWLRQHAESIRDGFAMVAEERRAGIDGGNWPLLRELPTTIPDTRLVIGMTALRRIDGREIPDVMDYVAENWEELISRLKRPIPVTWETIREHA